MFNTIYTVPYLVYRLIFDIGGDGIKPGEQWKKSPGYLGYGIIGDYTTQLYGDHNKPL